MQNRIQIATITILSILCLAAAMAMFERDTKFRHLATANVALEAERDTATAALATLQSDFDQMLVLIDRSNDRYTKMACLFAESVDRETELTDLLVTTQGEWKKSMASSKARDVEQNANFDAAIEGWEKANNRLAAEDPVAKKP